MDDSVYRACKVLVQNEGFKEVLAALTIDAHNMFSGSSPDDKDARERAYYLQASVTQIEQQVYSWAQMAK